jgi:hypothetical protein
MYETLSGVYEMILGMSKNAPEMPVSLFLPLNPIKGTS